MSNSPKEKPLSAERRLELLLTRQEQVNPDTMLTDVEVATLLNCSVGLLRIGRATNGKMISRGEIVVKNLPPHYVLFGRLIRYRYGDLMEWLQGQQKQT